MKKKVRVSLQSISTAAAKALRKTPVDTGIFRPSIGAPGKIAIKLGMPPYYVVWRMGER